MVRAIGGRLFRSQCDGLVQVRFRQIIAVQLLQRPAPLVTIAAAANSVIAKRRIKILLDPVFPRRR